MKICTPFNIAATISEVNMARTKKGFVIFNAGGTATGVQTPVTYTWAGPGTFYLESIYVFIGAFPVKVASADGVAPTDIIDLNVGIFHTNGEVITYAHADRYANTAGIGDVTFVRNFVTPWKISAGDGFDMHPYANGSGGIQWGMLIHVEGYVVP